ncbi:MAG: Rossmann-like and DUF2520 domain-containing protein [Bacteroidota bacterium]
MPSSASHLAQPATTLIGAGALGQVLGRGMHNAGYPIAAVISRTLLPAQLLADEVTGFASDHLLDLPAATRLVVCCVPDDALDQVADHLAMLPHEWARTTVLHTSGARTSEVWAPLQRKGAATMSFHPMQTFAPGQPSTFKGVYFGIEGDAAACEVGETLAVALGGLPVRLATEAKARYHLAASMASNFTVTLMALVSEVLADTGLDRPTSAALVRPLVQQTWTNLNQALPEDVLTGPIARGDVDTLGLHLDALGTYLPHLLPAYAALAAETVRVAVRGSHLSPLDAQRLLDRIHASLHPPDLL